MTDWKPTRVGPDFTAAEVSLREMVERSVCGIFSVHPGLISTNIDGSAMREAFRKYLRANLEGWFESPSLSSPVCSESLTYSSP